MDRIHRFNGAFEEKCKYSIFRILLNVNVMFGANARIGYIYS